jgi:tRNA threonylcarbamoyl adenosine modification protein (Sua5/YciO/YrdC/YwlC family)
MILTINRQHPEPRKITSAVGVLARGGIVAYPTDTVYGLGCDAFNKQAVERLYQLKAVPRKKPLALICADLGDIARYAIVDNAEYRVLKRLLPGPYCFVLKATREVPRMLQTKQKTVGIRVPNHPVTLAIVRELGRPLLTTTASEPGGDAMADAWTIDAAFPTLDLVLDADLCGAVPTTVVDLCDGEPVILRQGAGSIAELG